MVKHWQALAALIAAGLLALFGLASCSKHEEKSASETKVEVRTPVGDVETKSRNTDVDMSAIGLPVFPGARRLGDDRSSEAEAKIKAPFLGLKIVAVKFASDEAADKVIDFYRERLKQFGPVEADQGKSKHGGAVNIGAFNWDSSGSESALTAGKEGKQHVVVVKPAQKGCEFLLMYIGAGGPDEAKSPL